MARSLEGARSDKACGDLAKLDAIGEAFATAETIEEFRRDAGL